MYVWMDKQSKKVHLIAPHGRTFCLAENAFPETAAKLRNRSEVFPKYRALCRTCDQLSGYRTVIGSRIFGRSSPSVDVVQHSEDADQLDLEYRSVIGPPIQRNVVPKIVTKYQTCRLVDGHFQFSDLNGVFAE